MKKVNMKNFNEKMTQNLSDYCWTKDLAQALNITVGVFSQYDIKNEDDKLKCGSILFIRKNALSDTHKRKIQELKNNNIELFDMKNVLPFAHFNKLFNITTNKFYFSTKNNKDNVVKHEHFELFMHGKTKFVRFTGKFAECMENKTAYRLEKDDSIDDFDEVFYLDKMKKIVIGFY